ncbi:glycosyltransferase family 4 protein [Cellulophaga sp. HaHaR_3_176]|uniref:glycosyltransferase family 4 protein n=1 Tax=Cellulophaga sp. HaHaR_3_176 TaxID=1942464 RepID=UPI001C1F65BF|nr:glycosyltransferase family 4 protein [Cellulophaga sp. HaHaR_3_176]QWX84359.1 glycosyltransferase family 4 protein [Cellulophaga sp. HaHaR_3_176]
MHYPPPMHGAAMVGQYIMDSGLINENFENKFINLSTSTTIESIGKGGMGKLFRYISILWRSTIALLFFRPNLVYITLTSGGSGFYKDAIIALIAKMCNKKICYHFHNKRSTNEKRGFVSHNLNKIVFKNASVILLSKYLYPDFEEYVDIENVYYCPNGVPKIERDFSVEEAFSKKEVPKILFLSNLLVTKGVFVLLEALAILKNKKVDFNCTFVGAEGDIKTDDFYKELKKLNLNTSVNYVGKKYGAEKELIFSQNNIFVFPSFNETFGLVNLEAMQFSLPVISTFEGGIPDVVEDGVTGYLVPPKNTEKLADKIEELIKNPGLALKMGSKGKERYQENFTLKIWEKKLLGILKKITE